MNNFGLKIIRIRYSSPKNVLIFRPLQDSEIKERMVSSSNNEEIERRETFIRNEIEKWRKQKMKNEDLKKRELVPEKYSPAPDDLQAQNKYDEIVKADKRLQQSKYLTPTLSEVTYESNLI